MRRIAIGLVAVGLCLAACSSGTSSSTQTLTLSGSSTVAPLAAEIGKRFEELHPGTRVDVQTGGSSRGIADARAGLVDIGMVSRALTDEEHDLTPFVIARDGVAMIVHRDNPIAELTADQVRGIYTGKIERWSEVGGAGDAEITVVNKAEGRATLAVFLEALGLESPQVHADVIIGDNEQGIKTVAGDPNAIGYVSIGAAEVAAESGTPIRLLPFEGVPASRATLAAGEFPISRVLLMVTTSQPQGLAAQFLDFARSPEVNDLIEALSFVPVSRQGQ